MRADSLLLITVVLLAVYFSNSCYLHGTDSGECSTITTDRTWLEKYMPYCRLPMWDAPFPVCLPKYQTLPPSRQFPQGRWYNHTILTKDTWVRDKCEGWIAHRIALELNTTLKKLGINEYGDQGQIKRRMFHRPNCQNAYIALFCWMNFPRCDPTTNATLPLCRSACENFFITCGYEQDLWRCGKTQYFNGYFPEPPGSYGDNVTYLRDYFPGQPWRKNKYDKKTGDELPICTPAIKGAASRSMYSSIGVSMMAALVGTIAVAAQLILNM